MNAGTNPVDPILWPADWNGANIEVPTIETLQKKLWADDPAFSAWTRTVPDKHWAKHDLSAVRIGYELGKLVTAATAAPRDVTALITRWREESRHPCILPTVMMQLNKCIDELESALDVAPVKFSDRKTLVQVEPTEPMMEAYRNAFISEDRFDMRKVWAAMLKAALTAPPNAVKTGEGAGDST